MPFISLMQSEPVRRSHLAIGPSPMTAKFTLHGIYFELEFPEETDMLEVLERFEIYCSRLK